MLLPFAFSLFPFLLLATANSAGYRYGASDLAFYGPAVMRQLDPALFPRDTPLLDAQADLTFMDETVAAIARLTTRHLPALFLGLYVATLMLLAGAAAAIGHHLFGSRWAVCALLAALTLRHAIAKSGTNSLEGYFHPRQLAFAFGAIAVAAFLHGRLGGVVVALAAAALLHPTTTLWFAIWLSVAVFVAEPRWRAALGLGGVGGAMLAAWAIVAGPLAGRLMFMDADWLAALADKQYLFPLEWPVSAWIVNLAYVPIILLVYRRRAAAGLTSARESGLVLGCLALAVVFLGAVVLNGARVALAIQLQPARIFWMLDFLATVYAVWTIAGEAPLPSRRPVLAAAALLALSAGRGLYIMHVEFPDRPLFQVAVPGDWGLAAAWAQTTPPGTGWLADPMHAARYGSSLRMAAARDVFVEGTKDAAIGMYDRTMAIRTQDRLRRVTDFPTLSPDQARALGAEFQLDYLVTEQTLTLPLAFRAGAIRVYTIR